jgi:hypothetical protein
MDLDMMPFADDPEVARAELVVALFEAHEESSPLRAISLEGRRSEAIPEIDPRLLMPKMMPVSWAVESVLASRLPAAATG